MSRAMGFFFAESETKFNLRAGSYKENDLRRVERKGIRNGNATTVVCNAPKNGCFDPSNLRVAQAASSIITQLRAMRKEFN